MAKPRPLTGKQRKHLRGLAHGKSPVVQLGKDELTDAVIAAIDQALLDHEVVKVAMGRPDIGKKAMAEAIARRCQATNCGVIGHNVILYRPHPDEPQIVLP